jgi:hypothetical protein
MGHYRYIKALIFVCGLESAFEFNCSQGEVVNITRQALIAMGQQEQVLVDPLSDTMATTM